MGMSDTSHSNGASPDPWQAALKRPRSMLEKSPHPPNIPYRNDYRWHAITTLQPPHTAGRFFTNPDPRLRPRTFSYEAAEKPREYFRPKDMHTVRPREFPELSDLWLRLTLRTGVVYGLQIRKHYPNKAYVSNADRVVGISLEQLNTQDYSSLQFLLGHELGHAWRHKHPEAPHLQPVGALNASHRYEMEADLYAACLTNDKESIMRGLRLMGKFPDSISHPSTQRRLHAIEAMEATDCLAFDLKPLGPHLLYDNATHQASRAKNKKARE